MREKVQTLHTDLLALPDKQIRGALRHIWCDYTYPSIDTLRMAYKAISKANAKRIIETSQEHRRDRFDAAKAGRLDTYMEDVVRRLEKLSKAEEDDNKDGVTYIKHKQNLWDAQYLKHRENLIRTREPFQADYILKELLGLRPDTPDLDERATTQELEDLEADTRRKDTILEDWHTPPGSPWERSEDTTYDTTSLSWDMEEITFGTPPTSWDAGEEKEEKPSADDTEEEDDGLVILNTQTSDESNEETKTEEEKRTDDERA